MDLSLGFSLTKESSLSLESLSMMANIGPRRKMVNKPDEEDERKWYEDHQYQLEYKLATRQNGSEVKIQSVRSLATEYNKVVFYCNGNSRIELQRPSSDATRFICDYAAVVPQGERGGKLAHMYESYTSISPVKFFSLNEGPKNGGLTIVAEKSCSTTEILSAETNVQTRYTDDTLTKQLYRTISHITTCDLYYNISNIILSSNLGRYNDVTGGVNGADETEIYASYSEVPSPLFLLESETLTPYGAKGDLTVMDTKKYTIFGNWKDIIVSVVY